MYIYVYEDEYGNISNETARNIAQVKNESISDRRIFSKEKPLNLSIPIKFHSSPFTFRVFLSC